MRWFFSTENFLHALGTINDNFSIWLESVIPTMQTKNKKEKKRETHGGLGAARCALYVFPNTDNSTCTLCDDLPLTSLVTFQTEGVLCRQ